MTFEKCSYPKPLNREETAEYLGYSVSRLNAFASERKKPYFHKVGRDSYYHIADLEDFEKDQQIF
jgi:hypothetical protein